MKVLRIIFFMVLCLMGFATQAEEVTYTVKPGDTLSGIALTYHSSGAAVCVTNSLANCDLIYPKQKLRIAVPDRLVAVSSQRAVATTRVTVVHATPHTVVAKNLIQESRDNAVLVETSLYTCTIRPSGSPHCEVKAVLGHNAQVTPSSVAIPTVPLPLSDSRDAMQELRAETLTDLPDIDTTSAITFSVVKDLFPLSSNDARTKRRASIRKFLRTYLGPPHDLARMEDVLLDAPFPFLTRNLSRGEFKD